MIEANVTGRVGRGRLLRWQAFQDPLDSHLNGHVRLDQRVFATDSLVHFFPVLNLALSVAVEAGRALDASLRRAFFPAVLTSSRHSASVLLQSSSLAPYRNECAVKRHRAGVFFFFLHSPTRVHRHVSSLISSYLWAGVKQED